MTKYSFILFPSFKNSLGLLKENGQRWMSRAFRFYLFTCVFLTIYAVCLGQNAFSIRNESNPWADNYLSVADMNSYLKWGTYNVHDPSCLLIGDTYYMFSTDAIFGEDSTVIKQNNLPFGYIQMRKSKDLVHWQFAGWVFSQIPNEMRNWVLEQSGGMGANNIWAPYITKYHDKFRLYFCVSAFGRQTSCIGMAEADSPESKWNFKGIVVKTKTGDVMNAIDPSVITNPVNGEQWLHYGSYFGGLHCVQLNPETGFTRTPDDQGQLTARRFDGKKNNIEAPEVIYNSTVKKYFLFVSYDPLMTTYNVRVGRSDNPNGPFTDYFGKDMRLEEDNYPILTHSYQFKNHPGWAGTAHCSVFTGKDGEYYLAHQARLSPENQQMVLHVRRIIWTKDGWPIVSPERYDNDKDEKITSQNILGDWEIISIQGKTPSRELEAGQILWGQGHLQDQEVDKSQIIRLMSNGKITGEKQGRWDLKGNVLHLSFGKSKVETLVFSGHDWEREKHTLLFSGIDKNGNSLWGKRIE